MEEDAADAAELAVEDAPTAAELAVEDAAEDAADAADAGTYAAVVVQPVVRVAVMDVLGVQDVGLDVEMDVLGAGAHVEVVPVHQIVQVVEAVQAALADVSAAVWLKKEK